MGASRFRVNPTREVRVVASALAGLLLATGCGLVSGAQPGAEQEPDAPPDFTTVEAGDISFAYPSGWKKQAAKEDPDAGWRSVYEYSTDGAVVAQVGAFVKLPKSTDSRLAAETALVVGVAGRAQSLGRFGPREIDVPGADTAMRRDYEFDGEDDLAGKKVLGVQVVAMKGDQPLMVQIHRLGGTVDDETVEDIVGSIALSSRTP
jgi:hypothetical protein